MAGLTTNNTAQEIREAAAAAGINLPASNLNKAQLLELIDQALADQEEEGA